jgi:hypothetical protein
MYHLMQQDMLTVRENTRRNAASGFRPQSLYRPMFTLNPDNRRVTFIARTPTPSQDAQQQQQQQTDTSPEMAPASAEEGSREEAPAAVPGLEEVQQQPSTSSSVAAPLLAAHEREQRSGLEEPRGEKTKLAVPRRPPSPTPTPKRTRMRQPWDDPAPMTQQAPPPLRPPSPERGRLRGIRTQPSSPLTPTPWTRSPTPSGSSTLLHASAASVPPSGSRSISPGVVVAQPPVPSTSNSATTSALPSALPQQPLPHSPSPFAPPTWARSPLRNSVLPSSDDRPVVMPRPKIALPPPAQTEFLTAEAVSLRPSVPSLASSASQYSAASGEPPMRRAFFDSLGRRHKSAVGTIASSTHRASTFSSASEYSNND